MEIQFLGTSSGTPTKNRNVSALALRSPTSGHWSLVDCGEGTQHQVLHTTLSLVSLRAIFVTHIHGDHCYGLPGLLASAGMLNRAAPLFIVGPPTVRHYVECVLQTSQLCLPYPIQFVDVERGGPIDVLADLTVQATELSHRVPSFAYSFTEKTVENKLDVAKLKRDDVPAGPVWGQLQQGDDATLPDGRTLRSLDYILPPRQPRKIIVGGDNDTPELLADEARTAQVLVHESTYTEEVLVKMGPGPQHSSASRVARFASEANIPNLVLTHFSPRYEQQVKGKLSLDQIEDEARASYGGRLFLANDLERYVLDRQGVLARVG
jgi:ribonuclease Z